MRAIWLIGLLLILCVSGCCLPPQQAFHPPMAFLVTNYSAPITLDLAETPAQPTKHGKSKQVLFLWDILITDISFSFGDVALDQACKRGNITKLAYADYDYASYFWIVQTLQINAYGE